MKPPCDRQYMPAGPGHYMNRSQGTITLSPGGVPGSSLGGPPAFAHCSLIARSEGSACGVVDQVLGSLHSGDALTLVRWRPPLRWLLLFSLMLTTDSFTLPAGRSLRSLSPSARWTGRSAFLRCTPWADRLSSQSLPLPWERRSPARRVRREGDTRLSPGVTRGRESGCLRRISGAGPGHSGPSDRMGASH